jgi:6,7-dimethyl-8-ribityllumazine synthase
MIAPMSTQVPSEIKLEFPPTARVGIVAARFNAAIVDELLSGCMRRLKELGLDEKRCEIYRVPGAFELPVAAQTLAKTGRVSAVICLGCVVRGDTPHFDYVAGEAARGITQAALNTGIPIIFGVLTTNTDQQARDRTGGPHGHAGERAADAAAEMISVLARIQKQ